MWILSSVRHWSKNLEIVHDAAGDQAEIIFGSVSDAAMAGEVRVTVIATGFDKAPGQQDMFGRPGAGAAGVLQFPRKTATPSGSTQRPSVPDGTPPVPEVGEMEIPTFIRRQMD